MKHTYIQPCTKIIYILPTEMLAGSGDQKLPVSNTEVDEQGAKKGFFDDDEDATDATPSPW
ncbi:MAG: hypothetical protein PUG09_08865 [Prevotella sp.]|nr:hypothetical protein [Prevotella sp.]